MILFCLPCILLLASAQISGDKVTLHGCIKPKYEYVQKGSNLTLYCTLNETGYIERLGWNLNTDQYISRRINDSSSKVTILNLTADTIVVRCSVYLSTRQRIDEVKIQTGDPPETPQNISCIYFHKHNITCSWIHRRDPNIPTTAYLTLPDNTTQNCSAHTESCSFFSGLDLLGLECNITLHLENKLGSAAAQFTVNATRIVKMDPPKDLTLLPTKDPSFSISWKRPILAPDELYVKCGLRYRELQDGHGYYINELQMGIEKEISYILGGLHAHTEYSVSVRCIGSSGQVWWSEWTEEVTGRTEEQAPLHSVELWRVIGTTEGTRLVNLTWKERSGVRSTGITLGYNVLWLPDVRTSDWRNKTTKTNEMTLNITEEAHIISVVHINSAGHSPAAILRIPATWERAREVISSVRISTTASEETTLTWTVIDPRFRRFVLDWCIYSGVGSCNISFQYVENSSQWTIQKGILEPYKRYKISVYPLLDDRAEAPWITYYYIKEGAPLYGPNPKVEDLKETEVTMRWDPLRADESNGFITAFSIIYKPLDGQESVVTVNSDVYEYTLRSLMPDTKYSIYIVASTSGGKTSGNPIHFHTLPEIMNTNKLDRHQAHSQLLT
ncbi:hypothetical protein GDO81_011885 [Engystomops pustulosus]|uniref:Fibronectin type-III domain-containing protein n=1 Tax=Engystomops pustulosus TaxID=76066 RepID=A0AAV7BHE1_ENGPU|nr:hypothetical protein GDO81_011885 [Engystomops pustulosus]